MYRGEISFADFHFGNVLDWLRQSGKLDDMLVVLTADHGEEFFEHGQRGHGKSVYEEVTHIPVILRYPPMFKAGQRRDEPVDMLDLTATVALPGTGERPAGWLGRDLREHVEPRPIISTLLVGAKGSVTALRLDGLKMIYDDTTGRASFFNLVNDTAEKWALEGEAQSKAKELLGGKMRDSLRVVQSIRDKKKWRHEDDETDKEVPEDVLRALRALGYIE